MIMKDYMDNKAFFIANMLILGHQSLLRKGFDYIYIHTYMRSCDWFS